mmetsp:Transcript_160935/g.283606  ORF Transcript_160935/g.283606 Transcript_160935/m.283606 type:complete len:270 (-) Transcript_160935:101-910(-)
MARICFLLLTSTVWRLLPAARPRDDEGVVMRVARDTRVQTTPKGVGIKQKARLNYSEVFPRIKAISSQIYLEAGGNSSEVLPLSEATPIIAAHSRETAEKKSTEVALSQSEHLEEEEEEDGTANSLIGSLLSDNSNGTSADQEAAGRAAQEGGMRTGLHAAVAPTSMAGSVWTSITELTSDMLISFTKSEESLGKAKWVFPIFVIAAVLLAVLLVIRARVRRQENPSKTLEEKEEEEEDLEHISKLKRLQEERRQRFEERQQAHLSSGG